MTEDQVLLMARWMDLVGQLPSAKSILEKELVLRKEVMAAFFPTPTEGVNSAELGQGYVLKATYKIDRKVDEAALPAVFATLRELQVNPDLLIKRQPVLDLKAYRELLQINPIAAKVFDGAMTSKPASPILEVRAPK